MTYKTKISLVLVLIVVFVCNVLLSQGNIHPKDTGNTLQTKIREGVLVTRSRTVSFNKNGKTIAKVQLSDPIIVTMADEPQKWGFFQFPEINKTSDGTLIISWQMKADSYKSYGMNGIGNNKMISKNNGKTWNNYDGSYDTEWYNYSTHYGDEYMLIYTPQPTDLSKRINIPRGTESISNYGIQYIFYRDSELPDDLRGCYLWKWKSRNSIADDVKSVHATFNDDGLYRYATNDQMSVLWDGEVKTLENGNILGCTYRGFYSNYKGSISPSGISFYKWNEDNVSWDIQGRIPYQPDLAADPKGDIRKVWGFTEPTFVELKDSILLCVVRSSEEENITPMYKSISNDWGQTWSEPVAFTPNGVKPQLLRLNNETIVLSSGRPGVQIRFCFDGLGDNWTEPIDLIQFTNKNGSYRRDVSCGYTSLLPINDNSFFIVYSDFTVKNNRGQERKAIKIQKILVNKYL